MQDAMNRYVDMAKYSSFRVARVVALNTDNSVDLAFCDGNIAVGVPILSALNGTNFGTVVTAAPTPEPQGQFGATATLPDNPDGVDIYAVVGCFDGVRVARS